MDRRPALTYTHDWDLSTIPDAALQSEVGRRRVALRKTASGGRKITCTCGQCAKCKAREYRRQYRKTHR